MDFHDGCPIVFRFPSGMSNVISLPVHWDPSSIQVASCILSDWPTKKPLVSCHLLTICRGATKNIGKHTTFLSHLHISWDLSTGWMSEQGCPHFRIATHEPEKRCDLCEAALIPPLHTGCQEDISSWLPAIICYRHPTISTWRMFVHQYRFNTVLVKFDHPDWMAIDPLNLSPASCPPTPSKTAVTWHYA